MPGWLYIIPPLSSSSAGLSSDHLLLTELTVGIMPPPTLWPASSAGRNSGSINP